MIASPLAHLAAPDHKGVPWCEEETPRFWYASPPASDDPDELRMCPICLALMVELEEGER